ncbi:MAG: hypothetical protein FJ100_13220 [Deltaproteobacteria bacterium]|nr:hypothetical protein [Deltaproteobacteria bacterium]
MAWTHAETAWRDALFGAMLPRGVGRSGRPGFADLDLAAFWSRFERAAPWTLRWGLRASVWLLTWLPGPLGFGWRSVARLRADDRDRYVAMLLDSDHWVLRQLADTLKIVSCFAYFQDPAVRARVDATLP